MAVLRTDACEASVQLLPGACCPWHQGAAGAGVGVPARLTALPGLVSRPVVSPGAGHFSLTVLSLWRRVRAWQTSVQFIL